MTDDRQPDDTEPPASDQRGEDPTRTVGGGHPPDPGPDPDPGWRPDDTRADHWRNVYGRLAQRHRPRREDVLPFLLIRAFSPGDRGQRPLWPPVACWESPDILLIDAAWTGPFDPGRLVASPTAGRSYRLFVRVWNLGLLPAVGVHVRAWWVQPGFFGQANQGQQGYEPTLVGGAMVDLDNRTRPDSQRLVELDRPWSIPADISGHECLVATVSCPADQWSGQWDCNNDRHFGQRNLTVLAGHQDAGPLLWTLGDNLPRLSALHLTHGGPAAGPLLNAIAGGRLTIVPPQGDPFPTPVTPVPFDDLRQGARTELEQHILTIVRVEVDRTIIVRSDLLAALLAEREAPDPFTDIPALPGLIRNLPREDIDLVGAATRLPLVRAVPDALRTLLDIDNLQAANIASAMGGPSRSQHLLRFTATELDGRLIGGYSLVVT
ncbi:hypothetical protein AB0M80_28390 [Amycolatopsis sp. NPDC051045]|uniref:hypothetical protein n=1 Tax=Amycolatopsis sp. NPDC051045 TaxID=3156922 RepID=UPI00341D6AA1